MQYSAILNILTLVVPLFIGASKTVIKGNKKWIIAIVAYFILKKWAKDAALAESLSSLDKGNNHPSTLATLYDKAINPSGSPYLIDYDGTDEDLLYELAARSKNQYKAVVNAYQTQYKRELTTDIKNELSTEEYERWLKILNS